MLKFLPILLMIAYGILQWRFSVWRLTQELNAKSVRLADPRLKPVTDKIARALDVRDVPVHLYKIDAVNGLAAPDGRIFLTRGFYAKYCEGAVTAEELASVIAHELGHVALGHSRRRAIDFSGQNAVRMLLVAALGRIVPGLGPLIANALTTLLTARLSRRDEYEADEYASALLVKAGIGTAPQKSLLEKLHVLTASGARPPAWLMSHPDIADRVAAIEGYERKWGVTRV